MWREGLVLNRHAFRVFIRAPERSACPLDVHSIRTQVKAADAGRVADAALDIEADTGCMVTVRTGYGHLARAAASVA